MQDEKGYVNTCGKCIFHDTPTKSSSNHNFHMVFSMLVEDNYRKIIRDKICISNHIYGALCLHISDTHKLYLSLSVPDMTKKKRKHPPHVEVRWFMSRFSPNLETVATQKTCRAVTQGHVRGKTAQSKYSHKLTKVDTSTDVFDKFRLLCVFKCEPDGGEQQGLARSLIVCGGYTQGTLELIRAEERAFLTPEKKKKKRQKKSSVAQQDTVI